MEPKAYWAYIVASRSGTLYIGSTSDLMKRIWEHKNGVFEGFSKRYGCTRLVYWEKYSDPRSMVNRERKLKGWTRARKIELIENQNSRWTDLAEHWGLPMVLPGESIAEAEMRLNGMLRLKLPDTGSLVGNG